MKVKELKKTEKTKFEEKQSQEKISIFNLSQHSELWWGFFCITHDDKKVSAQNLL